MNWKTLTKLSKLFFVIQILVFAINMYDKNFPLTWIWLAIGFFLGVSGHVIQLLESSNKLLNKIANKILKLSKTETVNTNNASEYEKYEQKMRVTKLANEAYLEAKIREIKSEEEQIKKQKTAQRNQVHDVTGENASSGWHREYDKQLWEKLNKKPRDK